MRLSLSFLHIASAAGDAAVFIDLVEAGAFGLKRHQHCVGDLFQLAIRIAVDRGHNVFNVHFHRYTAYRYTAYRYTANPTAALTPAAANPTPGTW